MLRLLHVQIHNQLHVMNAKIQLWLLSLSHRHKLLENPSIAVDSPCLTAVFTIGLFLIGSIGEFPACPWRHRELLELHNVDFFNM